MSDAGGTRPDPEATAVGSGPERHDPFTRRHITVGPLRIHTTSAGGPGPDPSARTGSAVVFIHGLGLSSRYLMPTMELFAQDFVVLAPDLPGFGRTARASHALELPELAEVIVDWMDAVGLDKVALIGHSLGGQVVSHVADEHPERLSCLVLVSPSRDPEARWPWHQASGLLRDSLREKPSLLPIAVVDYVRAGPSRMLRTLRDGMATNDTQRFQRITVPTLVVRGGRDPVVSPRWTRLVTEALVAGRSVTLPGAPHGLPYSSAPALAAAIRPFVIEHLPDDGLA